jgi:hypothetical protein
MLLRCLDFFCRGDFLAAYSQATYEKEPESVKATPELVRVTSGLSQGHPTYDLCSSQ